jgi:hypothetical protein
MTSDKDFLSRWSRRKLEAGRQAAEPKTAPAPPPEADPPAGLPPVETLDIESDFKAFMRAKVDEGLRRAALKKLFSDPRFNVMDGLDVYIDDYSKADPIPPEMLARLEHAKRTLFGAGPKDEKREATSEQANAPAAGETAQAGEEAQRRPDGAAGQDPQAV